MSQLLREPVETPVPCDGYTEPSPHSGCTHHQMSKVRGDELWVIPLAPLLQCHHIRREEHVVSYVVMCLCVYVSVCVCVCVCPCSRMDNCLYALSMKRLGSFNFDASRLPTAAAGIYLCNQIMFSKHTYCEACEGNSCYDIIRTKIQFAREHAWEGDILYV